jgi:glycosyltransferase involved in cell wall biosynthesis
MKNQPLVSIIIPTYNRAHLIGETLDSVLAETYQNWECIIVDDGSSDTTDEVVEEYTKKDTRFKYYHRPDEHLPGGNGARNYGFKMSQGEYVNWLDSDDLFSENKIDEQVKVALKDKSDVVTCKWGVLNKKKRTINNNLLVYNYQSDLHSFLKNLYSEYCYMPNCSYLLKKDLVKNGCVWNEHLKINQDGLYFSLLFLNANSFSCATQAYVLYRKPEKQNTSNLTNYKIKDFIETLKIIESSYKIRFKEKMPIEFYKYKFKVYKRIKEFKTYNLANEDRLFFSKEIIKSFREGLLVKNIFFKIKALGFIKK